MPERVRTLAAEALHVVALVLGIGTALAGVVAVIAFLSGERGGHEVVAVVAALGVVGALSIAVAVFLDPAGFSADMTRGIGQNAPTGPADAETGHRIMVTDDVLYAAGVLLIGFAVLLGFICTWAGAPPANPFG